MWEDQPARPDGSFSPVTRLLPRGRETAHNLKPFVEALSGPHDVPRSLVVVQHGQVLVEQWWEPFHPCVAYELYSISKSVTAIAVGIAIDEGLLQLDDRIVDLFTDECPSTISDNLAAMTVRHLLTMTSGHREDTMPRLRREGAQWVNSILAEPVDYRPGTHYVYDSGASYLLSAALQSATGERLLDYLTPRLFGPIGIVGATWGQCPAGIDYGGFGLSMTTEAVAAFGQFCLQRGVWDGHQIVSDKWIDAATRAQVVTESENPDWALGYGYQFRPSRWGGYRAAGAFGQLCLVLPELAAVVVVTGGFDNAQRQLDTIWEHLLPVLAADECAPIGGTTSMREQVFGDAGLAGTNEWIQSDRSYVFDFPSNALGIDRIDLIQEAGDWRLVVTARGERRLVASVLTDSWTTSEFSSFAGEAQQLAVRAYGAPGGLLVIRGVSLLGPLACELRIQPSAGALSMSLTARHSLLCDLTEPIIGWSRK